MTSPDNGMLHNLPRNSFDGWRHTVTATSEKYGNGEINSVLRLKEKVLYAGNRKAGAIYSVNGKLDHVYVERNIFSFTISHNLKNSITAIKSYAQMLNP